MASYVQQNNSRRMGVLVGIGLFHILLVYGLMSGLARKVIEVVVAPIQTELLEDIKPEDKPPPPPPPQMERPPVQVPPPDISIDIPMETNTTAISNVTDRPVSPPAPVAVVERRPVRVAPKLDLRRSPSTDEFYPASARRAEIQGVTTVRMCVGANGRMSQEPTVANSSGNTSLDQAALRWSRRARWSPGTEDGNPVEICPSFNVRFKLTD
jgi:periplasmic protein TonB